MTSYKDMKSWTVCFRSTSVSPFVISPRWLLVPFDLFYRREDLACQTFPIISCDQLKLAFNFSKNVGVGGFVNNGKKYMLTLHLDYNHNCD